MSQLFFHGPLIGLPRVAEIELAAKAMAELERRCSASEDPALGMWARAVSDDPEARELLECVFSNSPFLTSCGLADIAFLRDVLTHGPDRAFGCVIDHVKDHLPREAERDRLMCGLRVARQQVAFVVALADITGYWPLERVTQALSDFADAALSASISHLMLQAAASGDLVLADEQFPEDDCGYVVLGMGKHGARELNYSSDIDLIFLYEPTKVDYRGSRSLQEMFIRITQTLLTILQRRTADGYVCRVDLRLSPDPRIAIPCAAAQAHYANRGEPWERAALIKARPAAGDLKLGRRVLAELIPFIWRKQLDFWTIRDIQAIKQRINAQRGSGAIGFLGHNIKVGRGGIREIEFFAQTQQLIFGGRDSYLRCQRTVDALTTLAEAGCIDEQVADELTEAYEFLRQLEHRLQMVSDQQTQTLPTDSAGMARLAGFMAFDHVDSFRDALLHHLRRVEAYYSGLFERAAGPGDARSLTFSGERPDDRTAALLKEFGFQYVECAYARLRRWHQGGLRASRDARSQELLVELIPRIVETVARTSDPDSALGRFHDFLAGLTAGLGCLSLLSANPVLLELLSEITMTAPALAGTLRHSPDQLQACLSAGFFDQLPDPRVLDADSAEVLSKAADLHEALELAVGWANDHKLQISIGVLRHTIDAADAGRAFADIAEAILRRVYSRLLRELARHEHPQHADIAVVAFGPFGTREVTIRSPLDLLFVYEDRAGADAFYPRLARRLTTAISATSASGRLCAVNLGAGPWGGCGPLVTPLGALRGLCADGRTVLPLLALGQMRVIAGPVALAQRVEDTFRSLLTERRNMEALAAGIARARHDAHSAAPAWGPWDLRHRPGGLDDIDTVVRILQLRHAPDHPEVLGPSLAAALAKFGALGLIGEPLVKALLDAHYLLRQMENMLAVAVDEPFDRVTAPGDLEAALVRAGGASDFETLEASLEEATRRVCAVLAELLGETGDTALSSAPAAT